MNRDLDEVCVHPCCGMTGGQARTCRLMRCRRRRARGGQASAWPPARPLAAPWRPAAPHPWLSPPRPGNAISTEPSRVGARVRGVCNGKIESDACVAYARGACDAQRASGWLSAATVDAPGEGRQSAAEGGGWTHRRALQSSPRPTPPRGRRPPCCARSWRVLHLTKALPPVEGSRHGR
jgi:hypothetical protein